MRARTTVAERVIGADDDCDGFVDNGATCDGLRRCVAGQCACPAENACPGACVDRSTSNDHCGAYGNRCAKGASCESGACRGELRRTPK